MLSLGIFASTPSSLLQIASVKDSPDKSTALITAVQEDKLVVTRKYRALSPRELPLFVDRSEYSLLQWRRRRPSFPLVSSSIPSHMVLVLSDIPRPCPKASLLPLAAIQLLVQACVLRWLGSTKSIVSVVLVANDISFAIMVAIFTTIGSVADYSTFGRWLLFTVALICCTLVWYMPVPCGRHCVLNDVVYSRIAGNSP